MVNKTQLNSQIRFAMEQLSERNAQHEWEHLCRHLARERICVNILPATGPVQAGGDQGRDFETFHTYLAQTKLRDSAFIGRMADKPIAFACTIQKQIPPKVKKDVATIMGSGAPVERIYFFCTKGLDVAKRHELQEWAKTTHQVDLEILDGAAVAELLEERNLFWIAVRFLELPAELFPTFAQEEEQNWYGRTLRKWQLRKELATTYADFSEVRSATREAMGAFQYGEDDEALDGYDKPELPFWIEKLEEIIANANIADLSRRAFYEASVSRLRGLGSLHGQEMRLRDYFNHVGQLESSSELEDAEVLSLYCAGAVMRDKVAISLEEIQGWQDALAKRLTTQIGLAKKHKMVNERCALMQIQGVLSVFDSYLRNDRTKANEALGIWMKVAHLAENARLFPLERFADRLAEYGRYVGDLPDYMTLTDRVDALLQERFGAFKSAEKCLARAESLRKAGDLPAAMAQVHRAKINWFAQETLSKSIQALYWLSQAYQRQGLFFAAKYYNLAVAYISLQSENLKLKPHIAHALLEAAQQDYVLGAWHNFLSLSKVSSGMYANFAVNPDSDWNDEDGFLNKWAFHLLSMDTITHRLFPEMAPHCRPQAEEAMKRFGLSEAWDELLPRIEDEWAKKDDESLWASVEKQLGGVPWSDSGETRRASWQAHGITWHFEWENDYKTHAAAEEFCAGLQIFLSDLAGIDMCLLRSTVYGQIRLSQPDDPSYKETVTKGFDVEFNPSNAERSVVVTLPVPLDGDTDSASSGEANFGILFTVGCLLQAVSLIPPAKFRQTMESRFQQGLHNKLFIGASYRKLWTTFYLEEDFEEPDRRIEADTVPQRAFVSRFPHVIPWFDGPGMNYNPDDVAVALKRRYERFSTPMNRTLAYLNNEPSFRETVLRLREDGWKDWHILSAIFNTTVNYRLNHSKFKDRVDFERETQRVREMSFKPEPEDVPLVPLSEYSEDKLKGHFFIYIGTVAENFGLRINQSTPDIKALEEFMARRYNFWEDDIEHTPIFDTP